LRREVADLAIAAAAKVIEKRLDAADDRRIVEEYLTRIGSRA
jgi:F0F1-type ATP synthase membrane subunit b/b'